MSVDAIQAELTDLSREERLQVLTFLHSLEAENRNEERLAESVRDFQEGRTVPASTVFQELQDRIANR